VAQSLTVAQQTTLHRLYTGAFSQVLDKGALAHFTALAKVSRGVLDVAALANALLAENEKASRNAGISPTFPENLSDEQFIRQVYAAVFARPVLDNASLRHYTTIYQTLGKDRGALIATLLEDAVNWNFTDEPDSSLRAAGIMTQTILAQRVEVSQYFVSLGTVIEAEDASGLAAIRKAVTDIDGRSESVAKVKADLDALQKSGSADTGLIPVTLSEDAAHLLSTTPEGEILRWNAPDAVGQGVQLSYNFLVLHPKGFPDPILPFTSAQKSATLEMLDAISGVANIDFVSLNSAWTADIGFANVSQMEAAGYTEILYYPNGKIDSANVIMNYAEIGREGYGVPGEHGNMTLLHEIAHALGLKHSFEFPYVSPEMENMRYTLMSYTAAEKSLIITEGTTWYQWEHLYPSTLMPLDIEALQYLYGPNRTARTGNDVYRWETNPEILETIWDAGGIDQIDCSNQTLTCLIDLRDGAYSSISLRQTEAEICQGMEISEEIIQEIRQKYPDIYADLYDGSDNLAIARGVVIENATGGSGDDFILGNQADNELRGLGGDDELHGALGNDRLFGGDGHDLLIGDDPGTAGGDRLEGGSGGDVYRFWAKCGQDAIFDESGNDVIQIESLLQRVRHSGSALVLELYDGRITIENFYQSGHAVETLEKFVRAGVTQDYDGDGVPDARLETQWTLNLVGLANSLGAGQETADFSAFLLG
jgi:hypothetical protein